MKATVPDVPLGVVTDTVPAPSVALAAIVRVVVSEVPVPFTVKVPAVMPVAEKFRAVAPVRLVPVRVTGTLVP